jgi:hypothetical protein
MTTLALAQIPSNINTLEKLHAWSTLALRAVNGGKNTIEAEGFLPERVAQAPITESPNDGIRLGCRVNIPVDPSFTSDKSKKLWEFAKELTTGDMPIPYTSN